ncbi:hypothetical protein [Actinophytocola sediminis]
MAAVDLQRRPVRWAVAIVVALLGVGVVVGGVVLSDRDDLDELLTRRAEAALERADPAMAGHHAHTGHAQPMDPNQRMDIDGNALRCVAEVFGHDPPEATSIGEVTMVYAHRMCAAVGPGLTWPDSIRETGPVALRLGVPDTLVLPEKALTDDLDANYADRIRAVVPPRLQQDALTYTEFVDEDVAEELQDRIDD